MRAGAKHVPVSGKWIPTDQKPIGFVLFLLLLSAPSFFYVAKYEILTDFCHFLYLARISRQAGISCMSYCMV